MKALLSFIILFIPFLSIAQLEEDGSINSDSCKPLCDVSFNSVFALRCPSASDVARMNNITIGEIDFNKDPGITIGGNSSCGQKAAELLKKYREEDFKQKDFLIREYCSASLGWRIIKDRYCMHGGPPPCCTAKSKPWEQISPDIAFNEYLAVQKKLFNERAKELENVVKPCKIEVDNKKSTYKSTIEKLTARFDEIKQKAFTTAHTSSEEYTNQISAISSKLHSANLKLQYGFGGNTKPFDTEEENALIILLVEIEKKLTDLDALLIILIDDYEEKKLAKDLKKEQEKSDSISKSNTQGSSSSYNYDVEQDNIMKENMGSVSDYMAMILGAGDYNEDEDLMNTFIRANFCLGFWNYPIVVNTYNYSVLNYTPISKNYNLSFPYVGAAVELHTLHHYLFNMNFSTYFKWGSNALLKENDDINGSHSNYGIDGKFTLGKKLRLSALLGWAGRSGYVSGNSILDESFEGRYNYSIIRYGGSIGYDWAGLNDGIELYTLIDKPSFENDASSSGLVFGLRIKFKMCMNFEFSPRYPSTGRMLYPGTYDPDMARTAFKINLYVPFIIYGKY